MKMKRPTIAQTRCFVSYRPIGRIIADVRALSRGE